MLEELIVEDLGIIETAQLDLSFGMTAITGETGAGKTMIVGAISFITGSKADPRTVRSGAKQASVQARFLVNNEEFVLSRTLDTSGKTKAYINGRAAALAEIQKLGLDFLDIHGQNGAMRLRSQSSQLDMLDKYAQIDFRPRLALEAQIANLRSEINRLSASNLEATQELNAVNRVLHEIDNAHLTTESEDEELRSELEELENSQEYLQIYNELAFGLLGDDNEKGAIGFLRDIARKATRLESMSALLSTISRVATDLDEISIDVKRRIDMLSDNHERVDEIRTRLVVLRDLKRQYGPDLVDVFNKRVELQNRQMQLGGSSRSIEQLEHDLGKYSDDLIKVLDSHKRAREGAKAQLEPLVNQKLEQLSLSGSNFSIRLGDSLDGSPVSFVFAPNRGQQPIEIAKFASGGELSRIMLALSLSVGTASETQVFDEIDQGIGGKTALDVGAALGALAANRQVVIVTHLAQVAVFAKHHFTISKVDFDNNTKMTLVKVKGDSRVREISRMLSGTTDSRTAYEHAKELLDLYSSHRGQ